MKSKIVFFTMVLLLLVQAGCGSQSSIADCWPDSVFTAEDMRARVDCHPNDYKLNIDKDTVVLFAFPASLIDWVGPIFIIHIPSVSEAVLNTDGSVFSWDYKSSEGRIAIERVLNNPELMSNILERAKEIGKRKDSSTSSPFRAVYLVQHPGQLSLDDLQSHPEVVVTTSFDEFKQHAQIKVALWIDKNGIELLDQQWLREAPQKYYPLALVGYNEPLYSFREALPVAQIEGPAMDWSAITLEPGFSVWMIRDNTGSSLSAYMRGYKQKPTVQAILDITNALLKGGTK